MDNIVGLFTSLEGRIGRGRWWLGVLILIIAAVVLSIILSLLGLGVLPNFAAFDPNNPAAFAETAAAATRSAAWGSLISFVIFAYPSYALSLKRRHDRDNNGLDLQIYYGLSFLMLLLQALGIGYTQTEVPGVPGVSMPTPSTPLAILSFIILIYALYLLVVLGFLRGTAGTNKYGPDPLGGNT